MTSPFEVAELIGGPWDGGQYARRGDRFPRELPFTKSGVVFLYVAEMGRLGNVVYRFVGRFQTKMEAIG